MTASLASLSTVLGPILARLKPGDPKQSILPFIPRPLKWLVLIILVINCRGLPLLWHIRVWRPAIYARLYHSIRNLIESPTQRVARLTRISPVGDDPFEAQTVFKTRATPDACDFNIHLSNSSYAMTYDMVRLKYVIDHFPLFYNDGGWIALGATHYVFTREIPINSSYEIRLSMQAWDNKWMYMVARYVTYPSKSKSKSSNPSKPVLENGPSSSRPSSSLAPPPPAVNSITSVVPSPSHSPAPTLPSVGPPLPPGAVLHCTAVSRLCCKIGRITIPPAVVIASTGYKVTSSRFAELQSWRFRDKGERIKAFYAGGWRSVPEGERWWEDALSGGIERRRVEGIKGLAATVGIPVIPSGGL